MLINVYRQVYHRVSASDITFFVDKAALLKTSIIILLFCLAYRFITSRKGLDYVAGVTDKYKRK